MLRSVAHSLEPFGAYVLLKPLGKGAMGDVHLARPYDPRRGVPTPVVIKRMLGDIAKEEVFIRRFLHEAAIAVSVDSAHVAKVYDVGSVGETLYIAMEYVPGWPLTRFIEAVGGSGRHAPLGSIAELALGALEGLEALHTAIDRESGRPLGIVHRDISPKNMMVGEDGALRLIDLGLGKSNAQDWKTRTGAVMGSVGYMPPEQVRAEGVDHRADLYSAAVVIWELLTMRQYIRRGKIHDMLVASLAPQFVPPSEIRPDIPKALDRVMEKALSLDRDARYQSARDFKAAFRAVLPPSGEVIRPMQSLIGDLFARQLPERKSEIAELLSLPLPDPPEEQERTVVYAHAEGVASLAEEEIAPTQLRTKATELRPAIAGGARPMSEIVTLTPAADPPSASGREVQAARGVSLTLFAIATTCALGLGALITLWLSSRPEEIPQQVPEEAPIAAPSARPSPGAVASPAPASEPEPPAPAHVESAPPEPDPKQKAKTVAKRKARDADEGREARTEPPKPAEPEEVSVDQVATRLLAKAKSMKTALPSGSPKAKTIDEIRAKISMETASHDPDRALRRLKELAAELAALERQ
jgi:eukaryotic-like serine/threonine-protein kinase